MSRKRLLAILGALGLVAGLISSGVAAQAATAAGPDWTYEGLLATYMWSGHDVCYSNGAPPVSTTPCVIVQHIPTTGKRNIAVCVQNSNTPVADEQCDITQTNDTHNNYALVIQRINQQAAGTSCPTAPPCQMATQRASILQTDSSGSNFGGVVQQVTQSLNAEGKDDDPTQTNQQDVRSLAPGVPGLQQSSGVDPTTGAGSNFAAVGQSSQQSQSGSIGQTQEAHQVAGQSESGQGINQTTRSPGANAAVLGQLQKQDLQSQVALGSQTENATQDGDIAQDDGSAAQNFASGNQFQNQREQGVSTTVQYQLGDPRCCSPQIAGGQFFINQATNQFASNALARHQTETIIGNCDSPPNGCTVIQRATVNGNTLPGDPCRAQASCHQEIFCSVEGCSAFPVSTGLLLSRPNLARRGPAVASAALLT